jgi:imidazolonepropionase-like amidohydrolase
MPIRWRQPVTLLNARVTSPAGVASSIRFTDRVLALGDPPGRGDAVIDVAGAFVLPGLINAHEHLELNHFGPLRLRDRYDNVDAWIDDLRPRLRSDRSIRDHARQPLAAKVFVGGLKNLLAGATTVAHHNPLYREVRRHVPVRVVARYGWAHSLSLQHEPVGARGEPGGDVRARCFATPADLPFIVHAAEGVDADAAEEVTRLEALDCLRANTVLVHGVAITPQQWTRILARGASLVWCPASNQFLFGRTTDVRQLLDRFPDAAERVCLGSDSRVTGSRDLLDELRAGAAAAPVRPAELLRMVTSAAARVLRLRDAGRLAVGAPADLVVLPPSEGDAADAVLAATRRDVALVAIGGRPIVGATIFARAFAARRVSSRVIVIDGSERLADARLARAIERCPIREPGVQCR